MVAVNIYGDLDDTTGPPAEIVAGMTALHFVATDVDSVDETADFAGGASGQMTYYLSAEASGVDSARSPVFTGPGPFRWDGWVPPEAASYTVHLRKVSDDSSVANGTFTAA